MTIQYYIITLPPSITIVIPVENEKSPHARERILFAISSGLPNLFIVFSFFALAISFLESDLRIESVYMSPNATEYDLMLYCPYSEDMCLVKLINPAFAIE